MELRSNSKSQGKLNCCKECLCSWLYSSPVLLREPVQLANWDGNDSCFFADWIFCSLVDWNCTAKDEFIVKDEHMWSQERGKQSCLVSAVTTKPVSSICTLIRGEKSPVNNNAWDESCGEKSATGGSLRMGIWIPQLTSINSCLLLLFLFGSKAGFDLPPRWPVSDHAIHW